jgi:hypothetical protein
MSMHGLGTTDEELQRLPRQPEREPRALSDLLLT